MAVLGLNVHNGIFDDELIDDGNIVFIEWAEKFAHLLPVDRLEISIDIQDVTKREFAFEAGGPNSVAVLERFAECFERR